MPLIKLSRRRTLLLFSLAAVAGALSISACSSEDNPPAGTLAVAVAPTSINVAPGGTGNAAASITRGGSFTGAVTLSASGAPAGITVSFTPSEVPGSSNASTVNVAVGAAVVPGTHAITISAEGSNVTSATTTLTVVVVGAEAGAISLVASPTALSVAAGAAAVTSTITITRTAPFAGAVGFTVTGAPAGVTASMNPVSAPGPTSTLSVSATASAVNGTYPLVVRGSGTGIADATVTVNATVTGGASAGASFTFSPTPLPITAGGASNTSTVTIARTGTFAPSGALNLAISGAPAGLTASVAPNSNVTGATATITAQATGAVAAGTYDLTLTGTGTGIPNATAILPVVVSGGGGGGSFTAAFCTADAPIWVAAQDGNGAWTRVNPTTGSTYSFTFASGRGGIAVVDTVGTGYDLNVVYGTVAEFTAFSTSVNLGGCGSKVVNGSVANVGASEAAIVSLGYSTAFVIPALSTNFQLTDVSDGGQDMIASRIDATTESANKLIIRRNQNIASGGSLALLDFNAAESFAPGTANVTVTGLGADHASILALYTGTYGSTFGIISSIGDYTTGAVTYAAVPLLNLTAYDLQQLVANSEDASNTHSTRAAGLYFRAPANRTIAMGAALSTPTVTKVVTAPNARPRVQLASQASYNRLFTASYDQGLSNRSASIAATAGYFSGLPATWDITLPDLSGAAGWSSTWGLQDGTAINWDVSAQGGAIQFLDGTTIVDGATFQSATITSATPLSLRAARNGKDRFSVTRQLTESLREQVNPLR